MNILQALKYTALNAFIFNVIMPIWIILIKIKNYESED